MSKLSSDSIKSLHLHLKDQLLYGHRLPPLLTDSHKHMKS
jgi:hypothetical protein